MRGLVSHAAVAAVAALTVVVCSGCGGTAYFRDRGRDARDIFTATGGVGMGACAKCAILNVGVLSFEDKAGLRAGQVYSDLGDGTSFAGQSDLLLMGETVFRTPETTLRGTDVLDLKFLCVSEIPTGGRSLGQMYQIELVAALGVGLRLGLNPAELVDFCLGWATIDLFNDDVGEGMPVRGRRIKPPTAQKTPDPADAPAGQ